MTAPQTERRRLTCLRCTYEWFPIAARPVTCPKCRRSDWDTPEQGAQEPPPPPAPLCIHQLTFRSEYAAYMARQGERDARAVAEHRERKGERRYAVGEVEVLPPMTQEGTPLVLTRLTLTRRKHRRKADA